MKVRKNESINLIRAKRLLENNGYAVNKKLRESNNEDNKSREEMKKYLSKLLFEAGDALDEVYYGIEKIVNTKVYPDSRDVSLSDSEKEILRNTQRQVYKISNYLADEYEYYTLKF